jgi:hypothetical protein
LTPIVGPFANIPATVPLSAEKPRWYKYVRRTSGANSGASRIVLRRPVEPVKLNSIRSELDQNGNAFTSPLALRINLLTSIQREPNCTDRPRGLATGGAIANTNTNRKTSEDHSVS